MKVLGIVDIAIAILFFLGNTFAKLSTIMPKSVIIWAGVILLVKGIFFLAFLDFASIADVVCGIIILIGGFTHIYWLLAFLVVVFLIQKGLLSLVS